jgi:hypothetical protein
MTPYASFARHAELPLQQRANTESGSTSLAVNYDKEAKSLQVIVDLSKQHHMCKNFHFPSQFWHHHLRKSKIQWRSETA